MDPHHVFRIVLADARGHERSPVAALRAVSVVAEASHQLRPRHADPLDVPTGRRRLVTEPVPRQRRDHHVERIGRVAPVRGGIGERADDLQELDDRPRPTVREHQRKRIGMGRPRVDEMDSDRVVAATAQLGAELGERVEPLLGRVEVVAVGPIAAQRLGVCERQPLRPVVDGLGFRPPRPRDGRAGPRSHRR